jgi:dsRNA-specific ribonuclease
MEFHSFQEKMHVLAKEIGYPCKKIDHLIFALKLSTTPGHIFFHSGFEAVGKSLLDAVNSHYLFTRGYLTEKGINEAKKVYLEKDPYGSFAKEHEVWKYVYDNDNFAEDKKSILPKGKDAVLLERIVGAMYYDSDWETTKNWIINNLGIRALKKTGAINSSK